MVSLTQTALATDALYLAEVGQSLVAPNFDSIAVLDSSFKQVFQKARPMKIDVRETIRPMEHPIESGEIITDYKIINPIEIIMPVVTQGLFYRGVYTEINNLYKNSELLTVQTRTRNYKNMIISEMPYEQRPEQYDVITINLKFKQIQYVTIASDFEPENPTDSNIQILGFQLPSLYTIAGTTLGLVGSIQTIRAQVR